MKLKPIEIPKEVKEYRKRYEELESRMHQLRKLGADMRIASYLQRIVNAKFAYVKATGSQDYLKIIKAALDEYEQEMNHAEELHKKDIDQELQKHVVLANAIIDDGEKLVSERKKEAAKALYNQIAKLYTNYPQPVKKQVIRRLTDFRKKYEEIMK